MAGTENYVQIKASNSEVIVSKFSIATGHL